MIINTGAVLCGVIHLHSKLWDESEPADWEGYCFGCVYSWCRLRSKLRWNWKGCVTLRYFSRLQNYMEHKLSAFCLVGVFWEVELLTVNAVNVAPDKKQWFDNNLEISTRASPCPHLLCLPNNFLTHSRQRSASTKKAPSLPNLSLISSIMCFIRA